MHLLRLRIRQVCEKYRTKSAQLKGMRQEIADIKAAGMLPCSDVEAERIIDEVHAQWGTDLELK